MSCDMELTCIVTIANSKRLNLVNTVITLCSTRNFKIRQQRPLPFLYGREFAGQMLCV